LQLRGFDWKPGSPRSHFVAKTSLFHTKYKHLAFDGTTSILPFLRIKQNPVNIFHIHTGCFAVSRRILSCEVGRIFKSEFIIAKWPIFVGFTLICGNIIAWILKVCMDGSGLRLGAGAAPGVEPG